GEFELNLAAHLLVSRSREADTARLGDAFETGGDVDAVAEDIVTLDDDVAEINADPKGDAPLLRQHGLALGGRTLHRDGAANCIDNALKLNEHAVTSGLDDATAMRRDRRIDPLAAEGAQARQGPFLIQPDQPAVAGDVGRQDRN